MLNVIFDIDGTLIESAKFDAELYSKAVVDILGNVTFRDEWSDYSHVTDNGILEQLLEDNELESSPEIFHNVRTRFSALIEQYLSSNACRAKPGVLETLILMNNNQDYNCGIATGGWGITARMKLQSAGIDTSWMPLFSSDDHYIRSEIMRLCYKCITPNGGDVVYIGDGCWDVEASANLGWNFIGVGDGLKGVSDLWILDFIDPAFGELLDELLRKSKR